MRLPAQSFQPAASSTGKLGPCNCGLSFRSEIVSGSWKLAAFFFVLIACATATTVIPISVERLTQLSSNVIMGHAVKSWSAWNIQHTMIQTYTQFSVDTALKGSSNTTITVKQPGGSAGGYTQHVAGVRSWSSGENAVLFLQPAPDHDGTFVVTGLVQGDFRVRRLSSGETIADNSVASSSKEIDEQIDSYSAADKSFTPYTGNRMELETLKQRVLSAARTQ